MTSKELYEPLTKSYKKYNVFGYQRTTLVVGTVGAERNAQQGVWGGGVISRLYVITKMLTNKC